MSQTFDYTVEAKGTVEEVTKRVENVTAEKGFTVLHTHNISETLNNKGFPREPLKIIEICNAKYASQVLKEDVKIALMLPCPISVYAEGDKTYISGFLPSSMVNFYPQANIEDVANAVEKALLSIIDESRE